MALINCPECDRKVSDSADTCPNCGYNIKSYLIRQKQAQVEAERKAQQKELERKRTEEQALRKQKIEAYKGKYLGTKKQRQKIVVSLITIFLVVACCIGIYLKATEDWRYTKERAERCIDNLHEIQNELYKRDVLREGVYLYPYQYSSLFGAGFDIAWFRQTYHDMDESERSKLDNYLVSKHGMTYAEMDEAFNQYGLTSQNISEERERDMEYYETLLSDLRNDVYKPEGKLSVTNVDASKSGDYFYVTGTVKNEKSSTVYFVTVRITLHDKDGKVINTESTYAVGSEGLRSGESSMFECYTKYLSNATEVKAEISDYDT